ncbi:MAG: peptidase MA family metallohydrolase [Anaerolineae bacterium]|jgi:hypothetical protein
MAARTLWLSLVAILVLHSSPTLASGGPEIEDNHAETDFPASVTFYLSLSGPAVIDSIELEYGTTQLTCGVASAKARPEFEPASQVQVSWTWDFRKAGGSPPPGARIWWRWHVEDEAGSQVSIEEQEIFFEDPRYTWQEIHSDELALYSAVSDDAVNQALWQAANQALDRLERDVGARPQRVLKIYNYPSIQDLHDARVFALDWTGGLAMSAYQTILLGVNQENLAWGERTVAHELTHIVIHQITFNCLGTLPYWLNEGLATYIEGDWEDYQQAVFDAALASDTLLSMQSLSSSFPTSSKRANLAYAQSRQMVAYLIDTYGPDKMADLLRVFQVGSTYDRALVQVYGFDTRNLENEWRISLGLAPRQIVITPTPVILPTLVPYGARSPTPEATPEPTITALPTPAATLEVRPAKETASLAVVQATRSPSQPTPNQSQVPGPISAAQELVGFPLALGLGAVLIILIVGILAVGSIWVRRSR